MQDTNDVLEQFDDLLFENPEICSHCFSRIRDKTEHDTDRLGTGNRPTETLERAGDGTLGQDIEIHDEYGAAKSYHARTFCSACGSDNGRARGDHIHSLQTLRRITDRIVRRLHEQGYYPDVATTYRVVEHLKQQPEYQGRDREILATAVYLGLERGAEAPAVPSRVRVDPLPDLPDS